MWAAFWISVFYVFLFLGGIWSYWHEFDLLHHFANQQFHVVLNHRYLIIRFMFCKICLNLLLSRNLFEIVAFSFFLLWNMMRYAAMNRQGTCFESPSSTSPLPGKVFQWQRSSRTWSVCVSLLFLFFWHTVFTVLASNCCRYEDQKANVHECRIAQADWLDGERW